MLHGTRRKTYREPLETLSEPLNLKAGESKDPLWSHGSVFRLLVEMVLYEACYNTQATNPPCLYSW